MRLAWPVSNQKQPSAHSAPIPVTCGLPSALIVASQLVCRPGPPASGFAGVSDCPNLDAAVAAGFGWARPDGVVLLSPAAPSFGHFKDYRDRGEAFARAVRAFG